MIFGRPTNLWLGLVTAVVSGVSFALLTAGVDPSVVAGVGAALTGVLGAAIALIAYQPPSVVQGGQINVTTPAGQPNVLATVNTPNSITPVP